MPGSRFLSAELCLKPGPARIAAQLVLIEPAPGPRLSLLQVAGGRNPALSGLRPRGRPAGLAVTRRTLQTGPRSPFASRQDGLSG